MSTPSIDEDLFDTVAADFLARFREGEHPTVDEYVTRHPELAEDIRELFPTMLAIERMKLQKEHSSGGQASLGARKIEQLGDFRIVREIGRGGMGIVFEAEQESLQRHVALKVLPPNALQDDTQVRRFHREAQTAARLHHTNIVPVFGVGEDEGLHYYVMQLIDGEPLDQVLHPGRTESIDPRRAADMVRQIAEAVQFAHDHGTLHRDIKPANLLLDHSGNVWITDFGLAHVLERDDTMTDHVAGTLRYMAPERFEGRADERSDQYSLGITLYELVTGSRAFEAATSGELLHRITHGEPTRLKLLAPSLPRDLRTIIEKAISREPKHRYARVGEFATDLERFLESRPIRARPISPPERLWRWCKRNRALAASLVSVALLLLVVAVMLGIGYVRVRSFNIDLEAALDEKDAALQSESSALANERSVREAAEAITELALDGLDQVFDEFAPSTPYITAVSVSDAGSVDADPLLLPAQTAVSPQVASALERLLPFYRKLADETAQDPTVRLRAASAQYRLGIIHRQLGRQDAARTAFWAARALLEELQAERIFPDVEYRLLLAQVLNDLGDLERQSPEYSRERQAAHEQALELLTELPPDELIREERLELARTHYLLGRRDGFFPRPPPRGADDRGRGGRGRRRRDNLSTSDSESNRADTPDEAARYENPSETVNRERRSSFWDRFRQPTREERSTHLSTAISLLNGLPYAERDTRVQLLIARCYREQASQRARDEQEQREADWDRAVAVLEQLVEEAPETPDFRFELSEAYADVDPRRAPDEALSEVEQRLQRALTLSRPLVAEAPEVPAYAAGLTQVLAKLAIVARRTNRDDDAHAYLSEAITVQGSLAERSPDNLVHVVFIARMQRHLVDIHLAEEEFDEAIALLREAAAAIEPFVSSDAARDTPAALFTAMTLGETYRTLADILRDQGDSAKAAEFEAKAREYAPTQLFRRRPPRDDSSIDRE